MIPSLIVCGNLMDRSLICVISYKVNQITYLTQEPEWYVQSTLTLAYLTTNELQQFWQISYDFTPRITDVYLM